MKLLRVGQPGQEKPAILDADGKVRDLSAHVNDIGGDAISPEGLKKIAAIDLASLPVLSDDRIGACVSGTGKFICIGLNFSDHAAETGATVPPEPVIFMKATSAIVGPNDNVVIPRGSEKTDWEVELGVVIGKTAKYVSEADALDYVAGYCVSHDVSERAFQSERQGQWTKGKSCDTFGPRWAVARHQGRSRRSAKPRHVAEGQRRDDAERLQQDHGLWRCPCRLLPQPVHVPASRRHHLHRHPSRRRSRHEAATLPQSWRRGRARHRRSRHTEADIRGRYLSLFRHLIYIASAGGETAGAFYILCMCEKMLS